MACVGTNHSLMLNVQKRDGSSEPKTLGSFSVGTGNQKLMLRASGCLESLTAVEVLPAAQKVAIFYLPYCMIL